jgi:hypothetical protein
VIPNGDPKVATWNLPGMVSFGSDDGPMGSRELAHLTAMRLPSGMKLNDP